MIGGRFRKTERGQRIKRESMKWRIWADSYLSQGPAISKGLCIVDFHVAGGGHIVHCHTVKISTQPTEEALNEK